MGSVLCKLTRLSLSEGQSRKEGSGLVPPFYTAAERMNIHVVSECNRNCKGKSLLIRSRSPGPGELSHSTQAPAGLGPNSMKWHHLSHAINPEALSPILTNFHLNYNYVPESFKKGQILFIIVCSSGCVIHYGSITRLRITLLFWGKFQLLVKVIYSG